MVFTKPSQPCPPHITVGCKRHWQREEKRDRILWMWVLQFPFTVKLWDSRNWPLWLLLHSFTATPHWKAVRKYWGWFKRHKGTSLVMCGPYWNSQWNGPNYFSWLIIYHISSLTKSLLWRCLACPGTALPEVTQASYGHLSSEMWHIETSTRGLDRFFPVLKLGSLRLIRYENNHVELEALGSHNYKIYPIISITVSTQPSALQLIFFFLAVTVSQKFLLITFSRPRMIEFLSFHRFSPSKINSSLSRF